MLQNFKATELNDEQLEKSVSDSFSKVDAYTKCKWTFLICGSVLLMFSFLFKERLFLVPMIFCFVLSGLYGVQVRKIRLFKEYLARKGIEL